MPDTNINAYFIAVDEAAAKVADATAQWNAAKADLEAKKKAIGFVEPKPEPSANVQPQEDSSKNTKSKK